MLRVMLVDDNKSVLEGLKYLIDWENCGYTIAASVRNGKEAIKEIDKTDIDLVITDIRMPQMTGLDLIVKMREKKPDLKFILISSYSEFDYAKWAIDNRISGYLLKPVDEDELIKVITDVREIIIKEREIQKQQQSYYLKSIFMGKDENIDDFFLADICKNVRYCMLRTDERKYIVSNQERHNPEQSDLLYNIISERISNYGCTIKNDAGEIEFIVCNDEHLSNMKNYFSGMNWELKKQLDFNFLFFVGEQVDIHDIYKSKLSIKKLANSVFYKGEENLFIYDDYNYKEYFVLLPDKILLDKVMYAIKNETEAELQKTINEFFEDVKNRRIDVKNVLSGIGNIIFELCNTMVKDGTDSAKYLYRYSLIEKENYQRLDKVQAFFAENALELRNMFETERKKNSLGIVAQILDYINTDYGNENLNLTYLAQKYHITASYLGKIFKKKTQTSFNNYLMLIRIEKAKEMLKNSDYKIYEIAYKVGFNDPNYFAVKFFETQKTSPAKYREFVQGKSEEE